MDKLFARISSTFLLYAVCAGIWGSTWLIIKFQIDGTDPVICVLIRFLISTIVLFIFALSTKRSLHYKMSDHLNFFFQGMGTFSLNYIIVYLAEIYAPSAMIALACTFNVVYNMIGMKIFFKKSVGLNVYIGAFLGILGISLIFKNEISILSTNTTTIIGLALGLLASLFSSIGNLFAYRSHLRRIPVSISNAWGMLYGTLVTFIIALILNKPFTFSGTEAFWLQQIYLSIFGTVIAFGAFLTLVGRVGAEKASYVSILSPMVAVVLSALFEDFKISFYIALGLVLCLLGNFMTLYFNRQKPTKV